MKREEKLVSDNGHKMAPLTLEDIMDFLKKEKVERAEEREADKKEITEMISTGVKSEVEIKLKPI